MVYRLLITAVLLLLIGCRRADIDTPHLSPLVKAATLLSDQRPKEALAICDEYLTEEPNNYHAILLRGEAHEMIGDRSAAKAAYESAFRLRPLDSEARGHLSRMQKQVSVAPVHVANQSFGDDIETGLPATSYPVDIATWAEDEKDYRREESAPPPKSPENVSASNSQLQRLLRALAEGKKKDLEAQQSAKAIVSIKQQIDWEAIPMDEPAPINVTRFDLGMGFDIDPTTIQLPFATTGQRRTYALHEASPEHQRLFAGQAARPRSASRSRPQSIFAFVGSCASEDANGYRLLPQCNDGRDNNGNGLKDRYDPVCWSDGESPWTYLEYLDESRMFWPTAVAPVLPARLGPPRSPPPPPRSIAPLFEP